ncbi:MAG: restriction endonuclease subunit S [Desulfobacterales bacterium]|nr:restriction endonuclease subunit S [Desulfobacterales bacterium]
MSEWKECKLGDVVRLNYGKGLPERKRKPGHVPVFSSAGITGWHNIPIVNNKGIIIGRKGTIGTVYYSDKPFFCIDTAYYIEPDEAKYDIKYLFYLLNTIGLKELNEDSAVPGLNRDTAYAQEIILPSLPEQRAIAGVLSSLDDKIDLLHRQNKTLEGMAEALWRKMFVEEADPEWKKGKLGDYGQIICGKTPSKKVVEYFGGHIPFIKIPDMHSNVFIFETEDSLTDMGRESQQNKTIPPKSICVSCIATVGLVGMNAFTSQTNQQINTIVPNKEFQRYFLFLLMRNTRRKH